MRCKVRRGWGHMNDFKTQPTLPDEITRLAQRIATLERVSTRSFLEFPVAIAVVDAPSNSIFRDSADNVIKIKDNGGTIRLLY